MANICPSCYHDNAPGDRACVVCGTLLPSGPHLPIGTLLKQNTYQIEDHLGQGAFGITYKAIYCPNQARIAIKELWVENGYRQGTTVIWPTSISPASKREQIDQFQFEASCLARCNSNHITKVYDYFEENSTIYMVMELIDGKPLSKIAQQEKQLAENRVIHYVLQVASALEIVHQSNLLHRDIKPENIMVDKSNRAVLIDFGTAREFIAGKTGDMTRIMTPEYAPIEQYLSRTKRLPATDIYALCASMYELLTGQLPSASMDRSHALAQDSPDPLIPPRQLNPNINPDLEKAILKGMEYKVEKRIATARDLIDSLHQIYATHSSPVQPTPRTSVKNICPCCLHENSPSDRTCIVCGTDLTPTTTASSSSPSSLLTSSLHLPPGTLLKQGQYQIHALLGQGSFAIGYQGLYCPNSAPVAIKELWPEDGYRNGQSVLWPPYISLREQRQKINKFKIEAVYLQRCKSPHIPKVYDCFEDNSTAYIVMELIDGTPLSKYLKNKGCLDENEVIDYMKQIAKALIIIHHNQLLHWDIKPENIMIDKNYRAVLIDFGTAREFIPGKTIAYIAYTASYSYPSAYAPFEQYLRKAKPFPATDIYALCASMYELLTGQLPSGAVDRVTAISGGRPDPLVSPRQLNPHISAYLEQIILQGLRFRVEERIQTAPDLIHALNRIPSSQPTPARLIPQQSNASIAEFSLNKLTLVGLFNPDTGPVDIDLEDFVGGTTVSRHHAEIFPQRGHWIVRDLRSTNGTFIKSSGQSRFGEKITTPTRLNPGDEIAFGQVRFLFQVIK